MKKVLLTIAIMFAAFTMASAMECAAPIDTSDFIAFGGDPTGGGRSLSVNEFRACIVHSGDNVFVVVIVLQNLGQMDFTITNTSTGEYLDGEFNALPGSYPIPISGTPGCYTIAFILPDGRSCNGTFELN